MLIAQSCLTLCSSMDCSPPDSSVHVILQARILEWVAISFSRGSSKPRNQTQVSCIGVRFFTLWTKREAPLSDIKLGLPSKIFPQHWNHQYHSCIILKQNLLSFIFSTSGCRHYEIYDVGNLGLIPGLGRSSGEGNGNPLQYSCLENPMEGGAR